MDRNHAFAVLICSLAAMILISTSMGTETWTVNTFSIRGATWDNETCRGMRTLGLFNGTDNFQTSGDCFRCEVIAINVFTEDTLSFNRGLLYAVIFFCGIALLNLVAVAAVSSYNLCTDVDLHLLGPIGLLLYLSTAVGAVIIAMILYIVIGLTEVNTSNPQPEAYETIRSDFGFSFYIFIASYLPLFLGILHAIRSQNLRKIKSTKDFRIAYSQKMTNNKVFMMY